MKKYFLVFAGCLLAVFSGTRSFAAAGLDVNKVLQRMDEANGRLQDLQADFVQIKEMALFDEKIVSKGKFYFRNPDKLILDTQSPEHQQLIINYNHVWLHYPELKQVHEFSIKQSKGLTAMFVGFGGSVNDIRDQFEVSLDKIEPAVRGVNSYTLSLVPKIGSPAASPALGLERVILTVTGEKWYPVRTEIVQRNGDRTVLEYSNQRDNLRLSEARFTFHPPAGTKVIPYNPESGVAQ
ncbi:MAG: hypothetical protein A3F83_02575 [Candidatus Glassbacteria bacterium RIFCSPLOWO2_12_FULL_58_11]|uniref:Outer membrane lipoprotein carrier protein LolA n=1 Tax=Candidatus Glassbacteria bacterium RIFCSPLOWO2_12_FULL_58_11 TaxID=1817867 RepID=A0A1F5YU18_9BACT|nr:MAG: hypothetical protein A3F83_02575 [Candidatus Glassbacteria bacterium RIFCSPLOWO2_12_FULL_58_11]